MVLPLPLKLAKIASSPMAYLVVTSSSSCIIRGAMAKHMDKRLIGGVTGKGINDVGLNDVG
jgi:hypothetical protein